MRYESAGKMDDLEEAIELLREALSVIPSDHPYRSFSAQLGSALMKRYTATGDPKYLEECVVAYRDAATLETSSILDRFRSSCAWATLTNSSHPSAMEAYEHAVGLLPRLASLGMDLQARQESLIKSDGLAPDAANYAILVGNLEKAVEFLEEGRAVFWSQVLRLCTPLVDFILWLPRWQKSCKKSRPPLKQGHFETCLGSPAKLPTNSEAWKKRLPVTAA